MVCRSGNRRECWNEGNANAGDDDALQCAATGNTPSLELPMRNFNVPLCGENRKASASDGRQKSLPLNAGSMSIPELTVVCPILPSAP